MEMNYMEEMAKGVLLDFDVCTCNQEENEQQEMTSLDHPTLYILMRTDMDSMNAGKAMAQAAHAANMFTDNVADCGCIEEWLGDRGFGTTIVLSVTTERELLEVVQAAQEDGFEADLVLDPTYPLRDGNYTHHLPVITCGYVFTPCRKRFQISSLAGLDLHK